MAQQTISDGESGLAVRNALNSMFGELYGSITTGAIKIQNAAAPFSQAIGVNTFVSGIAIVPVSGLITMSIGYTVGGNEILDSVEIDFFQPIVVQQYFQSGGTLYFTISGVGVVNIRIDIINNYA